MSKIYFKDDTEQQNEQINEGSFVRVPEGECLPECGFGIVIFSFKGWTVIRLSDGYMYRHLDRNTYANFIGWDSLHDLINDLHLKLITKPFVIEPDNSEEDDE